MQGRGMYTVQGPLACVGSSDAGDNGGDCRVEATALGGTSTATATRVGDGDGVGDGAGAGGEGVTEETGCRGED